MGGEKIMGDEPSHAKSTGGIAQPHTPWPQMIARTVVRFACPYCGRSRSKREAIGRHMGWCWKNPQARSCGTCAHHLPPERGEPACWITGYPGSPSIPRACEAGLSNAEALPRDCPAWSAAGQSLSSSVVDGATHNQKDFPDGC